MRATPKSAFKTKPPGFSGYSGGGGYPLEGRGEAPSGDSPDAFADYQYKDKGFFSKSFNWFGTVVLTSAIGYAAITLYSNRPKKTKEASM